ncbi:MAG: carboxypeptidase-like regulatory domain-containing protein, partial [Leeuwenhoekiella sp.]
MKQFLLPVILLLTSFCFAQKFQATGSVTDQEGTPLESATVYVEKIADSSLVTYSISEKDGSFKLSGDTDIKQANLFISYAGFKPYRKIVDIEKSMKLG